MVQTLQGIQHLWFASGLILTLFGLCELQLQLWVMSNEGHQRGSQGKGPALDVDCSSFLMQPCPFIQLCSILHASSIKVSAGATEQ